MYLFVGAFHPPESCSAAGFATGIVCCLCVAKKAAAAEAKAAAAAAAPTVVPYIAFDESAKALHAEGADHSLTAYNFLLCAFLQ